MEHAEGKRQRVEGRARRVGDRSHRDINKLMEQVSKYMDDKESQVFESWRIYLQLWKGMRAGRTLSLSFN